jgi:hypothetical protein
MILYDAGPLFWGVQLYYQLLLNLLKIMGSCKINFEVTTCTSFVMLRIRRILCGIME